MEREGRVRDVQKDKEKKGIEGIKKQKGKKKEKRDKEREGGLRRGRQIDRDERR
jgi:hypothetical protein